MIVMMSKSFPMPSAVLPPCSFPLKPRPGIAPGSDSFNGAKEVVMC